MSRARFVAVVLAAGYGGLVASWLSAVNDLSTAKRVVLAGAFGVLFSLVVYSWKNKRLR